jgi:hypothetical protein
MQDGVVPEKLFEEQFKVQGKIKVTIKESVTCPKKQHPLVLDGRTMFQHP